MDRDAVNSKPAILVVEDETPIRLWAAGLLEENGFSVLEAENAEAALKVLESRPDVKLLFTDVQMPGLSQWDGIGSRGSCALAACPLGDHVGPRKADTSGNSR
jgi:response regulator RpfG family c-di-GMP phosphodiesterase